MKQNSTERLLDILPWESINEAVKGLKPRGITCVTAKSKTGLHHLSLSLAINAWKNGYKVIYITSEKSIEEVKGDLSDIGGKHLPKNNNFQIYTLSKELKHIKLAIGALKENEKNILFIDSLNIFNKGLTLPWLLNKTHQYNFSVIYQEHKPHIRAGNRLYADVALFFERKGDQTFITIEKSRFNKAGETLSLKGSSLTEDIDKLGVNYYDTFS